MKCQRWNQKNLPELCCASNYYRKSFEQAVAPAWCINTLIVFGMKASRDDFRIEILHKWKVNGFANLFLVLKSKLPKNAVWCNRQCQIRQRRICKLWLCFIRQTWHDSFWARNNFWNSTFYIDGWLFSSACIHQTSSLNILLIYNTSFTVCDCLFLETLYLSIGSSGCFCISQTGIS